MTDEKKDDKLNSAATRSLYENRDLPELPVDPDNPVNKATNNIGQRQNRDLSAQIAERIRSLEIEIDNEIDLQSEALQKALPVSDKLKDLYKQLEDFKQLQLDINTAQIDVDSITELEEEVDGSLSVDRLDEVDVSYWFKTDKKERQIAIDDDVADLDEVERKVRLEMAYMKIAEELPRQPLTEVNPPLPWEDLSTQPEASVKKTAIDEIQAYADELETAPLGHEESTQRESEPYYLEMLRNDHLKQRQPQSFDSAGTVSDSEPTSTNSTLKNIQAFFKPVVDFFKQTIQKIESAFSKASNDSDDNPTHKP